MTKILIVDDSRIMRTIATRMLTANGFTIREAADGVAALQVCEAERPEGVLLDWNMPVMDGPTFLRTLRGAPGPYQPKVIFCTTEDDVGRIVEALEMGADEFIMKPYDEEILMSKLACVGLASLQAA